MKFTLRKGIHLFASIGIACSLFYLIDLGTGSGSRSWAKTQDRYSDWIDLSQHEQEGVDYQVMTEKHDSREVILAIHGGVIEPGTLELAEKLRQPKQSYYFFKSLASREPKRLHVTSIHFNDPRVLQLAQSSDFCISLHGFQESPSESIICLGGKNLPLRDQIQTTLMKEGFPARIQTACPSIEGTHPKNIVNLCKNQGVQIELSAQLRDRLLKESSLLERLSTLIRTAIDQKTKMHPAR